MTIGPVSTFDTFNRSLGGTWGRTDNQEVTANSQDWNGETNQYWDVDLTAGKGQIDVFSSFPSYDVAWIDIASYSIPYTNRQQVLTKLRWDTTGATDFGPALYVTDAKNYFYASIRQGDQRVGLRQINNGQWEDWGSVSFPLLANTDYWVRFEQNLMTFSIKIWKASVHEPASWTYTLMVASVPSTSNGVCRNWGLSARNMNVNHTVSVDSFYAWTLDEDAQPATVSDTFNRIRNDGWGKTDSGHIWEGTVSSNPKFYRRDRQGIVTTASGIGGRVETGFIGEQVAYINTSQTGDVNIYLEYQTNSGSVNAELYIGLCGAFQGTNGNLQYTGYGFKLVRNATNFTVHTKSAYGGAWSAALGTTSTTAFGAAIGSGTAYRVRVAKIGNQLYGRLWTGVTEPSTWNIVTAVDTTFSAGRPFIAVNNLDTTARQFDFHFFNFGTYVPATTTYTQVGALTVGTATPTTIPFTATYTNDTDNNNSVAIAYRRISDVTWISFGGTLTRDSASSPKKWTGTLTGLQPNEQYLIRATYSDAAGVVGTNPLYYTATTTTTGTLVLQPTASNVAQTTVTITQPYENDTNDNSTASLQYRTSVSLLTLYEDVFDAESGTDLGFYISPMITDWVIEPPNEGIAKIWRGQVYYESTGIPNSSVTYSSNGAFESDCAVTASIHAAGVNGYAAVVGRIVTSQTFYVAEYRMDTQQIVLYKMVSGVQTVLASTSHALAQGQAFDLTLSMLGTSISALADGAQVLSVTDSSITDAGNIGIRFTTTLSEIGTQFNQVNIDNILVTARVPATTFTTYGAMTADRINKRFTANVTGLTAGTFYEFRPVVSDTDGVSGVVNGSVVIQTKGVQIVPSAVTVSPSQTTAIVDIPYEYDTNNNATISIQYKAVTERLWKTLSPTGIRAHRTADPTKYFQTTLSGLRAGLSYEVQVTFIDPDGIPEGIATTWVQTFATEAFLHESEARSKYYLYKVYDADDKYITTWEDAEVPEFSFYENGGVSDLRVTLPRKISEINEPKSGIAFQNRIDVWEIDPSSNGFGINMIDNPTFEPALGGWLPQSGSESNAILGTDYGPGDGSGLKILSTDGTVYRIRSNYIPLYPPDLSLRGKYAGTNAIPVPIVISCMARAAGGKMIMDVESYASDEDVAIGASADLGMTIGNDWQVLKFEYTPPKDARYIRVQFRNEGKGNMYAGNVSVRPKEAMIYRGHIETFTPSVDDDGEKIEVEVLGLVSFLSDDYIDFLQYVEDSMQPQNDVDAGRPNKGPADPAKMLRDIIDLARQQNPRCPLYYTDTSIQNTGQLMRYTFRNKQLRGCFDKVRELCPSGWHYYVAPDGCVYLRDSATAPTHKLRVGVEVLKFSAERSIRNLKNYVVVKGRQDEDMSENGTYGSIREVAFDQDSIKRFGKRVLQINDAQIITPQDADLVAAGRLEEHNHEEQQVTCTVIDEKIITQAHNSLRGYNVESFRPGDNVVFFDPLSGPNKTYWNHFDWDEGFWDYGQDFQPLTDSVPIKRIQFQGDYITLELSERQPSSVGDFGRMYRVLQLRAEETGE